MTGNVREWQLELDAMFDATMAEVRTAVLELAIEGDALLRQRSPVDTGQFRANWLTSVGEPSAATQIGPSPAFASESAQALAAYPEDAFPAIYLQNNLPYANKIEDGHSNQAPGGVVAVTIPVLQGIWNAKTI